MSSRVVIIANKSWEVAPLVSVLMEPRARPSSIKDPRLVAPTGTATKAPRLRFELGSKTVEVWCVRDLMDPSVSGSLTWEKARVLPFITEEQEQPALVVAFGTAANPGDTDLNGSVVIGTKVFVHDPYDVPPDPAHHWTHPLLGHVVDGDVRLGPIPQDVVLEIERRMLRCPAASAPAPSVSWGAELVGVGAINVTNPDDYAEMDRRALDAFRSHGSGTPASLETTHGVIRLVCGNPFVFASGFANRVGRFDDENKPHIYSQNFAAAHNAAIAVSWLLEHL